MGPFSSHICSDYVIRRHQSYLSRARVVINKIEALLKVKEPNLVLKTLHITKIRAKFASGFDDLCSYLSLGQTIEELDRRHYGDAMYVSFYERLLKQQKKRKLDAAADAAVADQDANDE